MATRNLLCLCTAAALVFGLALVSGVGGLAGCGDSAAGGGGSDDDALIGGPDADAGGGSVTGDSGTSTPFGDAVIGGGGGGGTSDEADTSTGGGGGGGAVDPDATSDPDAEPASGTFGAPCDDNGDCFSGWCVEGPADFICTRACDESCPTGFDCKAVAAGSDVVFLCMPRLQKLCTPCTADQHCNGGKCLALDGENWCGFECEIPEDCPAGYGCQLDPTGEAAGSWCQPTTGSCSCTLDFDGGLRTCTVDNEIGECFGIETCDPDSGWSDCTAATPTGEICDGLDNDCDGLADDGLPSTQPCEHTNDEGTCTGTQVCVGAQGWVCDASEPAAELCNLVDDDCDGSVDEGFVAADGSWTTTEHCGGCGNDCTDKFPHATGACGDIDGAPLCVVGECEPGYQKLSDFVCGLAPDVTCQPCETDENCFGGKCIELDGELTCAKACDDEIQCATAFVCQALEGGGEETYCVPPIGSCSCNPTTSGAQRTCTVESVAGTCFGVEICDPELGWTACNSPTPSVEACDGLDNDCNGLVDDAILDVGLPCENSVDGVGSCDGIWACLGPQGMSCQGSVPEPEACDFKDNDCDGDVDEDFVVGNVYAAFDHCGTCNTSCNIGFPNAKSTKCEFTETSAQCVVVACDEGFVKLNPFQCIPNASSVCQPCSEDSNCLGEDAACVELSDGLYCAQACEDSGDCPSGFSCLEAGKPTKQCLPDTNACSCDGTNTDLSRSCSETFIPPDPLQPEYTCNGVQHCTADGWGDCVVPDEQCDGLDNDCDGEFDEEFKNAGGTYASIQHCGGCNISCLALGVPNADPLCDITGPVPACDYECTGDHEDIDGLPGNGCECLPVGGPDLAGDSIDSNCDGIDGEVDNGVFVAKDGNDGNPGTLAEPMLTIQAAISAADVGGLRDVYVATGVYSANVVLSEGIGVFGGYSSDFHTHETTLFETAIIGQDPTAQTPGAVTAVGIGASGGSPTILDGFTVFGANAANVAGANSYAVYIRNGGDRLKIRSNHILGGAGGNGDGGNPGGDGTDGQAAGAGLAVYDVGKIAAGGTRQCTNAQDQNNGGSAGSLTCPGNVKVNGGAGGTATCPSFNSPPSNVESGGGGFGPAAGSGGEAGWDLEFNANFACGTCQVPTGNMPFEPTHGTPGFDGTDGGPGQGCSATAGSVDNGHWVGTGGTLGGQGAHGSGGGGGGAGASVNVAGNSCNGENVDTCCTIHGFPGCSNPTVQACVCAGDPFCCSSEWDSFCVQEVATLGCGGCVDIGGVDIGGSGGGGGSGGCSGTGGAGGVAGGGSFGVFVTWDAGAGVLPAITGNEIRPGTGGAGGAGGPGGAGGQPGAGAPGGPAVGGNNLTWCATGGAEGGTGGRGGHGGGGGGGCGGASYGIYVWPLAGVAGLPTLTADNEFLPGGQGGNAGPGGSSLGSSGNSGANGAGAPANF